MRSQFVKFIKQYPFLFDVSKRISRLIGNSNPIYECLKEFSQLRPEISFLQIGSNDGISNDPLREFIVGNSKWQGCFVEPLPHLFKRLKKNYQFLGRNNLRYENVAVSDQTGELSFYRVKSEFHKEFPSYIDQIASFERSHIISHFPDHPNINDKIEMVNVKTLSIAKIADSFRESGIGILHLDVEGHEAVILSGFPFDSYLPEIILFEVMHLTITERKKISELLSYKGYSIFEVDMDTIALKRELTMRWTQHRIKSKSSPLET